MLIPVLISNQPSSPQAFADAMPIYEGDLLMGFLPLAHVFELLAESLCIIGGVPIGYSTPLTMLDSSSKIMKGTKGDATILQPTCITTVPVSYIIGFSEVSSKITF